MNHAVGDLKIRQGHGASSPGFCGAGVHIAALVQPEPALARDAPMAVEIPHSQHRRPPDHGSISPTPANCTSSNVAGSTVAVKVPADGVAPVIATASVPETAVAFDHRCAQTGRHGPGWHDASFPNLKTEAATTGALGAVPRPTRTQLRRLDTIRRSAGWPCADALELDLLASGWIERVYGLRRPRNAPPDGGRGWPAWPPPGRPTSAVATRTSSSPPMSPRIWRGAGAAGLERHSFPRATPPGPRRRRPAGTWCGQTFTRSANPVARTTCCPRSTR